MDVSGWFTSGANYFSWFLLEAVYMTLGPFMIVFSGLTIIGNWIIETALAPWVWLFTPAKPKDEKPSGGIKG